MYRLNLVLIIFTTLLSGCNNDVIESYSVGIENYESGDYESAIKKLTVVINLTDTCMNCYYCRGDAYRKLSEHEKAKSDFAKLISTSGSLNCLGYMNTGNIFYDEARYNDALKHYKRGLEFCIDSSLVMNMMSHMYFALNKRDSGCIYYHKSVILKDSEWNEEIPNYCEKR